MTFRLHILAFLGLLFVLTGCTQTGRATRVTECGRYTVYRDIPIRQAGPWLRTDIRIPMGALVAVMVQGDLYCGWGGGVEYRYPPWLALRLRVSDRGTGHRPGGGLKYSKPANTVVFRSQGDGFLQFRANHVSTTPPRVQVAAMTATVIVWPAQQDHLIEDMEALLEGHAVNPQAVHIPFQVAYHSVQEGRYEEARKMLSYVEARLETWQSSFLATYDEGRYGFCYIAFFNELNAGNHERAIELASEARRIALAAGDAQRKAISLAMLGTALARTGAFQRALAVNQEALGLVPKMSRKGLNAKWILAWVNANLARVYAAMDRHKAAEDHGRTALKWYDQWQPWTAAELRVHVGRAQWGLGRLEDAERTLLAAAEQGEKQTHLHVLIRAYGLLGRICEAQGKDGRAMRSYERAIGAVERLRGHLGHPADKASFLERQIHLYEWMMRLKWETGDDAGALHYLERARARDLLDMLADKTFSARDPALAALLEQHGDLVRAIKRLSMAGAGGLPGAAPSGGANTASTELARLHHRLHEVEARIKAVHPELASLLSINPLEASEIQALLEPDTALLAYFLGEESRRVFVVTRKRVRSAALPMDTHGLAALIRRFRHEAAGASTFGRYAATLAELHEALIEPAEPLIQGARHLVIVPHRVLHYLPFQALRTAAGPEGRYLLERCAVSYLPSASVLRYARAKNQARRSSLFAVGNPATDLLPLPGAEREVKEVSRLYARKRVLTGAGATERAVKTGAPAFDVLLFSTHGEMDEDMPLRSNLRFAAAEGDDGRLTVDEIFDLDIRANLVTLSACETGLAGAREGDMPRGDDLVGLSRAFIHAGSPSVVATLWKMSDAATADLVTRFFQNLETLDKAEALRQAQLAMMRNEIRPVVEARDRGVVTVPGRPEGILPGQHPFYWAPFILIGDWR